MIVAVADTHSAIWYLFSDPRLGKAASSFIEETVANGNHIGVSAISLAEFDEAIAMKMTEVPRQEIPDLPDRVIAAIALFHELPLLSRDGRIRSSGITTIW
jgi:PIN domain nuclease of toxin-antitoxin system